MLKLKRMLKCSIYSFIGKWYRYYVLLKSYSFVKRHVLFLFYRGMLAVTDQYLLNYICQ